MFYKKINNQLVKGTHIHNKDYKLTSNSDHNDLPDGWKWFENDDDAYDYFGIEKPKEEKIIDRTTRIKRL